MKGILIAGAAGAAVAYVVLAGSKYLTTASSTDGKLPAGATVGKYAPYLVGAAALIALHKFAPSAA